MTEGYGLIEGPVWVPDRGLMFSDVLGGGVFCLTESGVLKRFFSIGEGLVGCRSIKMGG